MHTTIFSVFFGFVLGSVAATGPNCSYVDGFISFHPLGFLSLVVSSANIGQISLIPNRCQDFGAHMRVQGINFPIDVRISLKFECQPGGKVLVQIYENNDLCSGNPRSHTVTPPQDVTVINFNGLAEVKLNVKHASCSGSDSCSATFGVSRKCNLPTAQFYANMTVATEKCFYMDPSLRSRLSGTQGVEEVFKAINVQAAKLECCDDGSLLVRNYTSTTCSPSSKANSFRIPAAQNGVCYDLSKVQGALQPLPHSIYATPSWKCSNKISCSSTIPFIHNLGTSTGSNSLKLPSCQCTSTLRPSKTVSSNDCQRAKIALALVGLVSKNLGESDVAIGYCQSLEVEYLSLNPIDRKPKRQLFAFVLNCQSNGVTVNVYKDQLCATTPVAKSLQINSGVTIINTPVYDLQIRLISSNCGQTPDICGIQIGLSETCDGKNSKIFFATGLPQGKCSTVDKSFFSYMRTFSSWGRINKVLDTFTFTNVGFECCSNGDLLLTNYSDSGCGTIGSGYRIPSSYNGQNCYILTPPTVSTSQANTKVTASPVLVETQWVCKTKTVDCSKYPLLNTPSCTSCASGIRFLPAQVANVSSVASSVSNITTSGTTTSKSKTLSPVIIIIVILSSIMTIGALALLAYLCGGRRGTYVIKDDDAPSGQIQVTTKKGYANFEDNEDA